MRLKAALLVDNMSLSKWNKNALEEAAKKIDIAFILNCQNTNNKKQIFKHFFYYVLNFLSLKNHLTKREILTELESEIISFESTYDGAWQSIPKSVSENLLNEDVNVIIKFGMNLLYIDENLEKMPVLSFHHGNPSKYRGRPAGFYEILNGEKTTGIIVQQLTNKLDAGRVIAFAESKVINYSYKKTAINFYTNSKYLLSKAIDNLISNTDVEIEKEGKNYKLPSNTTVIKFVFLLFSNAIEKLIYGLFFEKKWKVATTRNQLQLQGDEAISSEQLEEVPIFSEYNFYADPFFSTDGSLIRLEALRNGSGLGDILEISAHDFNNQRVLMTGAHYSYPHSFNNDGLELILPEVASHSPQYFIDLNEKNENKCLLIGLDNKRIVDATMFEHEGWCFLFFGLNSSAHSVLNLWISDSPYEKFSPHPNSPISISPKCARMGGNIANIGQRLLRFGQNNEGGYGESLSLLEITELTPSSYSESYLGSITMADFKGPHSLNFSPDGKRIAIDYYRDEFSILAGIRRIKARLSSSS